MKMSSSDDEGEIVQNNVTDYKFVYGADEELISFANLPEDWTEGENHDGKQKRIYLSGKADNGLRAIYIQVTAWKFVLPKEKPEISVLSVQGNWIKLLKPWNPFNDIIRTILVTLHVLHFAMWNPRRPQKALWDTLNKTFRFERRPCVDDLADHVPLITEAIKRDEKLAKSKLLSAFLTEKPWQKKIINEDVEPPFIVDEVYEIEDEGGPKKADENEDSKVKQGKEVDNNEDSDSKDDVCAICDNGGNLYICDGKCMRSFHATVEDDEDSACDSLGLTDAELEAIKNVPFMCANCKYKKHQCFACGKLGSSDELSNPEVFCCANGACGYFYHPHCVARLLHPGNNAEAEELENNIASGEPFSCPIHNCHVCNEVETRSINDLQFAVCRRCPKAYHRKCLPSEIAFDERAWEDLIPKRILIYCLDHEIDEDLHTPSRDHIIFPGPWQEKRKTLELESNKHKKLSKAKVLDSENNAGNKISGKQQESSGKVLSTSKGGRLSRKRLLELPPSSSLEMRKLAAKRKFREKLKESTTNEEGLSSVYLSCSDLCDTDSEPVNSSKGATGNRKENTWTLDTDARRRVLTLMNHARSSVTLEEVKKRHKPLSHTLYPRFSADQVTFGKVQGSIQAIRAALKKLDGGSVQDAKAVCGDELLEQVLKWKEKLKVYLAPFLHGSRYTSFGRHFTKLDKLKEIVELLHWYIQDGDMLVDFCCGSNDFSCLMKNKLDEMGKICSFKNYDILQAKNDFNFERRDWMGVKKGELPDGSKLIMGLNPPFGVNAALANKFIDKALEFKPKLLILIVPRETQRLDEKIPPYDLIWEDDQLLAGKSFYLPGSVDVNDKQIEDWNVTAPVLYLWSEPAWTAKHRVIADQHSHISGVSKSHRLDEKHNELLTANSALTFENKLFSEGEAKHADAPNKPDQKSKEIISHQEGLPRDINGSEMGKKHTAVKSHLVSSPRNSDEKGNKKRPSNAVLKDNSSSKPSAPRHGSLDRDYHPENYPTGRLETPAQVDSQRDEYGKSNVANRTERLETPPQAHCRRDEYGQSNVANRTERMETPPQAHHRRDEYGLSNVANQTERLENPPQAHLGRAYQHTETLRRGGYQHHHHQQQFSQTNITAHQSYSATEFNENDEMIDVVSKYIDGPRGAAGMQAYNPRYNPDQGNRQMGSHFEPMREGFEATRIGHGIPDYGRQLMGSSYGGLQHNQGTAYPHTDNRFGARGMMGNSSYGGLNTSVTQRYASRLDDMGVGQPETQQGHHRPKPPPHQVSLGFAPAPFNPPYSREYDGSFGWIEE